jgi:hypothetical protein
MHDESTPSFGPVGFDVTAPAIVAKAPGPREEGRLHRAALVVSAMISGATPEEVAGYLEEGFPAETHEALERPWELAEIRAHVHLLQVAAAA